jgi:hypothetical protein
VSELDHASATATTDAPRPEPAGEQRPGSYDSQVRYPRAVSAADTDPGYYDDDVQAALAADSTPTRQRAARDAAAHDNQAGDGTTATSGDAPASDRDGDVEAILHENDHLAEPRTRQQAARDADADSHTAEGANAVTHDTPAGGPDASIEAILHENDHLAEPRTRQQAARDAAVETSPARQNDAPAAASDQPPPSGPDPLTRTATKTKSATDPSLDHAEHDKSLTERPEAQAHTAHGQADHDVPITVVQATAEMRTLGDETPTGIGVKPTGEELFRMEGERVRNRWDRLLDEAVKEADDVYDGAGHIGEPLAEDFRSAPPPTDRPTTHHIAASVPDLPQQGPAINDAVGSLALVGIAVAVGVRYGVSRIGKGRK